MSVPKPPSKKQKYIWERERLAEAFLCAALMGNAANPTAKAAFDAAEDFMAELKARNDSLTDAQVR